MTRSAGKARWPAWSVRELVSLIPMITALAVVAGIGLVAEQQSRHLAAQTQRTRAQMGLEVLRNGLETRLNDQIGELSQISGALVAAPDMSQERFAAVAEAFIDGPAQVRAFVAMPADGGPLLMAGDGVRTGEIAGILTAAPPGSAGTRGMVSDNRAFLLLWRPVGTGAPAGRPNWGFAAAVIDAEALFADAGLRDAGLNLELALSTADARPGSRARALQLGHAAVLTNDPVTVRIAVPGGDWELAAQPVGGWSAETGGVWPIRILTLVSFCLVGAPMWRTRRLMRERQDHITVLRQRETQLAQLSQRLGLALDASSVGVWDFNIDTDELIWDGRMDDIYGYSDRPGRRAYADWRIRLHPADLARAEEDFRQAVEETGNYRSEFRIVLDDGAIRHVRAIAEVYQAPDGGSRIVGVNWDVTADIVHRDELEAQRAEAEAALRAKSDFLATMSHEIRTPMNGVIGMLDLLLAGELIPEQRARAGLVRQSAGHLLDIVNDTLDFSKLEADRIVFDRQPTDVTRLAGEVVTLMSAAVQGRDLRIYTSVEGQAPPPVCIDPSRIRQVLCNLIGNAAKFTDSGTIELRVGYEGGDAGVLRFSVRDTGVGIPEESKAALFGRYAQVDPKGARERKGTGLGLAICKQLVEAMGGEIGVDSVPGLGSTFSFWIPAAAADHPADPATLRVDGTDGPAEPPRTPRTARSARILVAEDNATNRKVLSGYLEMAGHEVDIVENGAEAVQALAEAAYDLVILDIQMPVMDGLAAAREIRAAGADVPIIAVTGKTAEHERRDALDAGMDAYVTKPIEVEALFGAIDRVCAAYSSTGVQPSPGSNAVMAPATSSVSSPRSAS